MRVPAGGLGVAGIVIAVTVTMEKATNIVGHLSLADSRMRMAAHCSYLLVALRTA
jgi:hypothetical protein